MTQIQITTKEFKKLHVSRQEYIVFQDEIFLKKLTAISCLIPNDFRAVFGHQSFCFNGSKMLFNWAFEFEGERYFFATASERGTTIESTSIDENKLRRFVDLFLEKMKDNKTVQFWLNS